MAIESSQWANVTQVPSRSWKCGFCSQSVASDRGWVNGSSGNNRVSGGTYAVIRLCPHCGWPSFFHLNDPPVPGSLPGSPVSDLPPDLEALYEEARRSAAAGAHTASVLVCRKLLLHVAVEKGASADSNFLQCVEYLDKEHYLPREAKGWLDYVRRKGNEANHEIVVMAEADGRALVELIEMLLRLVYEFPKKAPPPP